jgi:hypothetical protein
LRELETTEEGKIVHMHDNKICHDCGIVFKRASGKRAHDQNYHGINTGMMAGSPRQRKFIFDLEYTQLLELIIERRELDMMSIYASTKLPASSVICLIKQLEDSGVVRVDENINVNDPNQATKRVRLV